jgi:hypothetical protein
MSSASPTSRHPRHRAIAELDMLIRQAEEKMERYLMEAESLDQTMRSAGRVPAMLRMEEKHLQELYKSRRVLLSDT